jgi:DnaJ-class molecular chaperone
MRDPYAVLGVDRKASEAEIKSAFRKLAKRHHPDRNQNDPKAKERFSEASRAYEILGDKEKRGQYDRGEIDAEGKPKFAGFEGFGGGRAQGGDPFGPGGPFAGFEFSTRRGPGAGAGGFGNAEDILQSIFGDRGGRGFSQAPRGGPSLDISAEARVGVEDLARGKATVQVDGRTLSFSLPPEPADGQVIRLAGQGRKAAGRKPGDALVTLRMAPHTRFAVSGADLRVEVPLPLETAVRGGKVEVETLDGRLSLSIPAWTDSGTVFRLRGKGLPKKGGGHGDLLVAVEIRLPIAERDKLERLFAKAPAQR